MKSVDQVERKKKIDGDRASWEGADEGDRMLFSLGIHQKSFHEYFVFADAWLVRTAGMQMGYSYSQLGEEGRLEISKRKMTE